MKCSIYGSLTYEFFFSHHTYIMIEKLTAHLSFTDTFPRPSFISLSPLSLPYWDLSVMCGWLKKYSVCVCVLCGVSALPSYCVME